MSLQSSFTRSQGNAERARPSGRASCVARASRDELCARRQVLHASGLLALSSVVGSAAAVPPAADAASILPSGASSWPTRDYRRMLHSVSVVKDLTETQTFYSDVLGMKKLRYRSFEDGSANGFSGVLSELDGFSLELVQKATTPAVRTGDDFRHWGIRVASVDAATAAATAAGYPVIQGTEPGEEGEVYVQDPSGYRWQITEGRSEKEPFFEISLRVADLARSLTYYCDVLGMTVVKETSGPNFKQAYVCWGKPEDNTQLELTELLDRSGPIDTGSDAYVQIAVSSSDIYKTAEQIREAGGKITREPAPVPGIGTRVMKAADPDGWVMAFVDYDDFLKELL